MQGKLARIAGNVVKEHMSVNEDGSGTVLTQWIEYTREQLENEFRGTTRNMWDGESYEPFFICAECHAAAQETYEDVSEWRVYPFLFCPYCGRRIKREE